MQFSIEYDLDQNSNKLLILLILTDIVFIALHCLHFYTGLLPSPLFSIGKERGYGEMYQYVKEFLIVILLFFLSLTRLNILYFGWSNLFIYMLLDDSFQIHEKGGIFLAYKFNFQPIFGFPPDEALGELIIFIFFGIIFLSIIGATYYLSSGYDRKVSKFLIIMVALLAFFGIFIDLISMIFSIGNRISVVIEDGGEMFVMSIIAWYVYGINELDKYITNSD